MAAITYHRSYDGNHEDVEYTICEGGEPIGYVFKETYSCGSFYHRMKEYGIDARLEDRFGSNAFAGHSNIRALIKDVRQSINALR